MVDSFARSDKRMVTGLFPDRTSAETAYQAVTERGYSRDDVNLVMSDAARERHFGDAIGTDTELGTKAATGAGIGGAIGGSLGAIAAAIAAVGTSLVLPGLGLVVAGPLAAAIVGAGAGGATGGILGALIGYGIPEERVAHYEQGIRNGGILMGVTPRSEEDAIHFQSKWTESRGEHVLGGDALDTRVGKDESHVSVPVQGPDTSIGSGNPATAVDVARFDTTPGAMAEATLAGGAVSVFDPSADDVVWREAHQRAPYASVGHSFDDYAPAYRLGAASRRHSDQSFDNSEPMLRGQWESVKGSSRLSWEEAKEAARAAWNHIT